MAEFQIAIRDMSLKQIAESGQVFRMKEEEGGFLVRKGKKKVFLSEKEGVFTFDCSEAEFREVWYDYFDLGLDYGKIKALVGEEDRHLREAIAYGEGIRILKQDLWEMVISFMISQNNNIPRIKSCIEKICSTTVEGGFPTAEELARIPVETLRGFGLGYRDVYVHEMAVAVANGDFDLESLKEMKYEEAHRTLLSRHGIGKKVADCICVFGLHHLDAFPIDTHVKQILEEHYPNGFPFEKYRGYAAVMQQYLFYYRLKEGK